MGNVQRIKDLGLNEMPLPHHSCEGSGIYAEEEAKKKVIRASEVKNFKDMAFSRYNKLHAHVKSQGL